MPAIFPRGGKRVREEVKDDKEEDLFKTAESLAPGPKSKGRKKLKPVHRSKHTHVEVLNFQTLSEGLVLLGRVKEVQDYRVMVSLPHGLLGTLPITAISHAYSQRLQALADSDKDDSQEVASPKELFRVGDGVPCCITKVTTKGKKRLVELSCDPRVVNKDLPVMALKAGCVLYGAVQSVEEHGCMMDVGIPGIQAFLTDTGLSAEETQRSVGRCMWCTVTPEAGLEVIARETRVIKVTATDVLESEVSPQSIPSFDCLHPGMKVKVTIEKVLKDGLYVKCIKYKGCVYKTHVTQALALYSVGKEVEGRILYIHPTNKVISLSLLPGLLHCVQSDEAPFAGLSTGDVIEGAEVLYVDKDDAVFFRFQGYTALAPIQHLSDDKIKDINRAFPRGSKHRCRVIGFQPADDMLLVSLKESVMKQRLLSIKDLQPGQIVEGTVETIHNSGVIVTLSRGLTALIPKLHVADIPLKHFDKKFKKGNKVKCRVLKADPRTKKVLLSNKKSLVNTTKDVPASFSDLKAGMQIEGYIIAVKDNGVAVGFCADVKGWVPRSELSTVEITHPETAFYQGQVVRCCVLSCRPEQQNLRLSLIITGKAAIASKAEKMADFEVGKLMEAKVKKKLDKNLEVELLPSGTKALLPREHLSDSPDNQQLLWQALEPGDSVGTIMLLKQTNVTIVTLKESFVSAAREGLIPKSIEDIEPGQLLPGVIKNHQSYGIFVELPGGLGGLAPHKLTMDRPAPDLTKVFDCGQSVVVKVVEVKEDKGRFLCSLRMVDCYHDDPAVGVEMLETYLSERDQYLDCVLNTKAEGLKTGSLITAKVKKKTRDGYICDTTFGLPAIITDLHTGEAELTVGHAVEAVVLHIAVDQSQVCLELSADQSLVSWVSRRAEKRTMDRARVGQHIKAKVLLVKDDFVLMMLKQHAVGMLAFVPRRQHPNDVLARTTSFLTVGEETKVAIQESEGDRVLAILSSLAKEEEERPRHTLKMGDIVTAQIQTILPAQMNLKIGGVSARVHVTEAVDRVENGIFPFKDYKKGQEVKVKIVGFRHFKSFKYLPISHPRLHKAMPECTLKPSKVQQAGCPKEQQASHTHSYQPGDKVPVFAIKYENNKLWVNITPAQSGVISVFDLSRDLGVLKYAEKNFAPGHGYLATVLGVEDDDGVIHLSLTGKKEAVKKNQVVTGKVTSVSDQGVALRLPGDFRGMVPPSDSEEDWQKAWHHLSVGAFIRCLVLCCRHTNRCMLSLNLTHRSEDELKKIHMTVKGQKKKPRQQKRKQNSESEIASETAAGPTSQKRARRRTISASSEESESPSTEAEEEEGEEFLKVDSGFTWNETPTQPKVKDSKEDEEDDDGEEEEKKPPKKKKKKAAAEPSAVSSASQEDVKEDYERRLLTTPNNSQLWIEWMCLQLNEGKVDKARGIANQALQTIALTEEQEKLNMWIALLNLENLYGSKEDVTKTMQRALQVTDPHKLYRRVAAMYSASGNTEEAETIHQTLVRKFKQDRQVWIDFGLFLFKQGRLEPARKLLQRALLSLERRDHVATITQFASLECKHGESERGFTMLEKTISEFPKRSDVMSVYIDMVVRAGDMDRARELFERALTLKNTKFFYKKYLQFEEKHGTEDTLARLRSRIEEEC
ncbi:protein RRP5 homolog [Littorina saxatilis]|uniref:S1 motif domain-containing protein n=1 Tax=Littorina saxatilis TaxID=31220 RepID=A0AAN9BTJ0_9CAEN